MSYYQINASYRIKSELEHWLPYPKPSSKSFFQRWYDLSQILCLAQASMIFYPFWIAAWIDETICILSLWVYFLLPSLGNLMPLVLPCSKWPGGRFLGSFSRFCWCDWVGVSFLGSLWGSLVLIRTGWFLIIVWIGFLMIGLPKPWGGGSLKTISGGGGGGGCWWTSCTSSGR